MASIPMFSFSSKNFGPQKGWDLIPHHEILSALCFFFYSYFYSFPKFIDYLKKGHDTSKGDTLLLLLYTVLDTKIHKHVKVGDCSLCLKTSTLNCSRGLRKWIPGKSTCCSCKGPGFHTQHRWILTPVRITTWRVQTTLVGMETLFTAGGS